MHYIPGDEEQPALVEQPAVVVTRYTTQDPGDVLLDDRDIVCD